MRIVTRTASVAVALVFWAGAAGAQEWTPDKPIQIVVGFAPGGGSDQAARNIAAAAQGDFPVPLVVENKPGAAGVLAAQTVANTKPDGYTLLVAGGSETTSVPAHRAVPYDPAKDFTSIIRLTNNPFFIIVKADSPFKTVQDIVAAAKEKPGKISLANTGIGGLPHSIGGMIEKAAGVRLKEVPFQGGAPIMQALLGGQVDVAMGATEEIQGQVEAGTIRVLAGSGEERSSHYPAVPTLKELGYDVVATNMKGLVGPAGLPPQVVKYLHDKFHAAMERAVWRKFADAVGEPSNYTDAAGFAAAQKSQLDRVRATMKP
ncbi:tripartite tricarboxylate transporter substrate binding protein [Xanthobacter dioxanivorans]|uniref:Tripartite tricarboxylate transporter substrate binding protein n=1 Tax=Xanthobacter dioxanivorans TaxID=2528964 RepID=A0A974PTD1_9HYPH|nr:tripartite tricarboxylate transporter substrate binding protein [Xanthobacter dioxanivorans]QRG08883.1 tripartite tricarboxylate transporter substrate binding protein [Xanthobacter dioxanivorans]